MRDIWTPTTCMCVCVCAGWPVYLGGRCQQEARALHSRFDYGMVAAEGAVAGPRPLWHHHHFVSAYHGSDSCHWSPGHTAPSPETHRHPFLKLVSLLSCYMVCMGFVCHLSKSFSQGLSGCSFSVAPCCQPCFLGLCSWQLDHVFSFWKALFFLSILSCGFTRSALC